MNSEEIIEMARPRAWYGNVEGWTFNSYEELEAFAKLVAEKQQRTWVGLTDEEAQKTFAKHNCTISADLAGILARAIGAKLKEKNT